MNEGENKGGGELHFAEKSKVGPQLFLWATVGKKEEIRGGRGYILQKNLGWGINCIPLCHRTVERMPPFPYTHLKEKEIERGR